MNKKITIGLFFGSLAGIIDVTPMIIMKLPLDALLSAFSLWVISGFFIATSSLKINNILKGILISFLVLTPCAFLIGANNPINLIPVFIMTMILGSLLGLLINKFTN